MAEFQTLACRVYRKGCRIIVPLLAVSLLATACLKNPESRGYALEYAKFDDIKPGITTREQTEQLLGSPSSTSSFGKETWYYIGMKLERVAFLNPDLVEQKAVAITFDSKGIVESVDSNHGEHNRNIAFAKDKTPTEGNKVTVVEQFLGNLGRFNTDQKTKREIKPRM